MVVMKSSTAAGPPDTDLLIAGGGLAGGLIALTFVQQRPDVRVTVVEAGETFGGNHTWSCFLSDLPEGGADLVRQLVAHRWSGHEVRFPGHARQLSGAYQSATSARLHSALCAALPPERRITKAAVAELSRDGARLADGRVLRAAAVIDARGQVDAARLDLGFQKFVGLELELEAPHGLGAPVIMDATVDQLGGYRFVYVLPFTPTTLLVEDTCYADGPSIDEAAMAGQVAEYVQARGWVVRRIIRRETGVLPIAIGGDIRAHLAQFPPGVAPVGLGAGLFHPVTGYSLPDAARLALHLAHLPVIQGDAVDRAARQFAVQTWEARGFYRMLNKMLFRAAVPDERWRVLARFYRLDEGLIRRFYGANCHWRDRLRILSGRPPVPLGRAVRAILGGGAPAAGGGK